MTTRSKSGISRIEVEIEKNREEGNWLKVIELAQQLKDKSNEFGNSVKHSYNWPLVLLFFLVCLSDFLIGEGKLENYLEEYPAIESNIHKAKSGLIEAKRYLNMVITDAGIKVFN